MKTLIGPLFEEIRAVCLCGIFPSQDSVFLLTVWVQSKLVHIGSAQQREWVRIKRFMWEKQKKENNSGSGIDFLSCGLVDRPDYTVETLKSAGCQQGLCLFVLLFNYESTNINFRWNAFVRHSSLWLFPFVGKMKTS